MDKVIQVIGVVFAAMGVVFVIKPEIAVGLVKFFSKGPLVYVPGIVRIVLGVVFLVAVRECRFRWLILAFGVVLVVAGVVLLMIKPEKLRSFLQWWTKRPLWLIRLAGLLATVCGGAIFWAA